MVQVSVKRKRKASPPRIAQPAVPKDELLNPLNAPVEHAQPSSMIQKNQGFRTNKLQEEFLDHQFIERNEAQLKYSNNIDEQVKLKREQEICDVAITNIGEYQRENDKEIRDELEEKAQQPKSYKEMKHSIVKSIYKGSLRNGSALGALGKSIVDEANKNNEEAERGMFTDYRRQRQRGILELNGTEINDPNIDEFFTPHAIDISKDILTKHGYVKRSNYRKSTSVFSEDMEELRLSQSAKEHNIERKRKLEHQLNLEFIRNRRLSNQAGRQVQTHSEMNRNRRMMTEDRLRHLGHLEQDRVGVREGKFDYMIEKPEIVIESATPKESPRGRQERQRERQLEIIESLYPTQSLVEEDPSSSSSSRYHTAQSREEIEEELVEESPSSPSSSSEGPSRKTRYGTFNMKTISIGNHTIQGPSTWPISHSRGIGKHVTTEVAHARMEELVEYRHLPNIEDMKSEKFRKVWAENFGKPLSRRSSGLSRPTLI